MNTIEQSTPKSPEGDFRSRLRGREVLRSLKNLFLIRINQYFMEEE